MVLLEILGMQLQNQWVAGYRFQLGGCLCSPVSLSQQFAKNRSLGHMFSKKYTF